MRRSAKRDQPVAIEELFTFSLSAMWRAMRQQNIAFWMLIALVFFEYVRPQSIYSSLAFLPWSQLAMIGAIIAAFADKGSTWRGSSMNKLLILFAFIVILSGIFAFRPQVSLKYWDVMTGWVITYFLFTSVINTQHRLFLLMVAYLLFSLKMAQHGAHTWAARGFSFAGHGLIGAPGYFHNSGEYAIQMLVYGSLAMSMVYGVKRYVTRNMFWILFLLAIMGYMAVMGASSRGAQLALLATVIWAMTKSEKGLKGIVVMVVLGVLLYNVMPDAQMDRFREMGEDRNSLQRLAYWEYAIDEVIPNYPWLGLGYYNWTAYLHFMVPGGMGPMQMNQVIHNIFLEVIVEEGFIGLIVWLAMIIVAFRMTARTRKYAKAMDNDFLFYISLGLDAGMIGYLVAGNFASVFFYPFFWIQIAMIVSTHNVAASMHREAFPEEYDTRRRRGPAARRGGQEQQELAG